MWHLVDRAGRHDRAGVDARADRDPMMTRTAGISDQLAAARVVPVVTRLAPRYARALAAALVRGGLPVIEVTLRAAGAIEAIGAIAADPPDGLLVGAGTVLSVDQVDAAVDAGARFVVSPGLSARVVARCAARGVPCIPGVLTASEVMAALDEGLDLLKFFPAEAAGGVTMLRALSAPFPQARWVPTGGITTANLADYLAVPVVTAVGGSWMVKPELIEAGRFDEIERLAREAATVAVAAREGVR
jgi:2-dehydro-3-deoxyphosphogluconate aldolase/(4S)-4-hydroxy-2-oxoglutarate aldolase